MITSDINETLRIIINLAAFILFIYIFLQEYGIAFSHYPKLPIEIYSYLFLVILVMIVSSALSKQPIIGFYETFRQLFFFILVYILYSYLSRYLLISKYIAIIVSASIIIAILIIYSFFTSDLAIFLLQAQGIVHEGGGFKNVTAAGGIFAVSIPLTLLFILKGDDNHRIKSFLLITLLIIQFIGLFLTNSRSGILAAVISTTLVIYILRRSKLKQYLISLALIVTVLLFVLPALSELFSLYFRVDRIFENTRFPLWNMSLNIIRENFIVGTGPGQFKNFMYNHIPVMLGSWEEEQIAWIYKNAGLGESHNFLLFKSAELGLMGFLIAIYLPFVFIRISIKTMKLIDRSNKDFAIAAVIFSMGVGMFFRSLFESTGLLSNGWIVRDLPFWICFSVLIHLYMRYTKNSEIKL
ncbi:MAG: O-antigen ligase family protein [Ignavibacteriaceae bacterium]|nr:O-antigen ligase family protein [Ignavibacteriaceae bacterium]